MTRCSPVAPRYLAKADLTTQMVTEMTSLQGIIGREYALRSGEVPGSGGGHRRAVPSRPGDQDRAGCMALADRIDSLVGLFAVDLAPTGTKDPFGLRRAAIGVVQPLIEHDMDFDLVEAVKKSARLQPVPVTDEVQAQVLDFIAGRLSVVLKDDGFKYDVVDAVLAAQSNNPAGSARAVKQLQAWVEREDWRTILPAFARCVRITRDQKQAFSVNEKTFGREGREGFVQSAGEGGKDQTGRRLCGRFPERFRPDDSRCQCLLRQGAGHGGG